MNPGDHGTPLKTTTRTTAAARPRGDTAGRHARARTAPKGRATPKRGEQQMLVARRRARTRRLELLLLTAIAVAFLAVALVAGGGSGNAPIRIHG